jgi:hypothetical protein
MSCHETLRGQEVLLCLVSRLCLPLQRGLALPSHVTFSCSASLFLDTRLYLALPGGVVLSFLALARGLALQLGPALPSHVDLPNLALPSLSLPSMRPCLFLPCHEALPWLSKRPCLATRNCLALPCHKAFLYFAFAT